MKFYSFEYTSDHLEFETALFISILVTWSIAQIKFLKYFDHANTKNNYHFYLILWTHVNCSWMTLQKGILMEYIS